PSGPGLPGMGDPNQQRAKNTVRLSRSDKIVMVTIDLEWKDDYGNKIRPYISDYFEGVGGQGMMLATKYPWKKLSDAVKKFQASGKYPRGAMSRRSVAARMGLPFAPEQRVSWMVELLPHIGYGQLYNSIDKDMGWNS